MSKTKSYYTYRARALRVIDGDTLEVMIDQGFHDYKVITIRVADIDTAEIFGVKKESEEYQQGIEQKEHTEEFVEVGEHEFGEWPLSIRSFGKGKYGRWVSPVWKDGGRLADSLAEQWPDVWD